METSEISEKTKKNILIIEDEMEMRFYLMALVKSMGHHPVMARNGTHGLEALNESMGTVLPDLIILDVMMPEKGGALVYREVKSDKRLQDIPLLIFSGVDPSAFSHYIKMLNADPGCDVPVPKYYVEKSADPDYLKRVITDCMNDPNP